MLEPVLYICLTQSLFAGVVIASKRPQLLADRFLAAWLFIIGIETLLALVKLNFLSHVPYQLPFLMVPFLYGPLLLFYVRSLILIRPGFHPLEWAHFLPFALILGLTFLFRENTAEITAGSAAPLTASRLARVLFSLLLFLSFSTYSILVYILLNRHRKKLKEEFSFSSGKITLNWLLFVSITVYVSYLLTFFSSGIQLFYITLPFDPLIFSYTGLTLFSFAFSFYGYRQAAIYHNPENLIPSYQVQEPVNQKKYYKSGLTNNGMNDCISRIDQLMHDQRLYLEPELSIDQVAAALKIPKHHLTQALNTVLEKNFYTYINELRVKAFIERLKDPSSGNYTLLALAFDCGFNSKSTFNAVFKKTTGMTPSEFSQQAAGISPD